MMTPCCAHIKAGVLSTRIDASDCAAAAAAAGSKFELAACQAHEGPHNQMRPSRTIVAAAAAAAAARVQQCWMCIKLDHTQLSLVLEKSTTIEACQNHSVRQIRHKSADTYVQSEAAAATEQRQGNQGRLLRCNLHFAPLNKAQPASTLS